MIAFYFDVGGVIIPDTFAPERALEVFRQLSARYAFDPEDAHRTYIALQPLLDRGAASLGELCSKLRISESMFERDWLALHPVDRRVLAVIEQLLSQGHTVGLATNFCRHLLDLLVDGVPILSRLSICCSSDIGFAKPSSEFFRHAREIIRSTDIVFVDDREINVEAAREFGWTAIHAREGWLNQFKRAYVPKLCSSFTKRQ